MGWTFSGYLIAAAVATPVFGRLGDMYGKRRLLVISLWLFAAGSAVSALADSLDAVVVGRVLQGAGGGIFPLCFGIIRDEFPRDRVARSIGLISATVGIGGGFGLVLGGVLLDHTSYHWIFVAGLVMASVGAIGTQLWVPESPIRSPGRVDVRGALVLGVGLTLPMIAIARANEWGWTSGRTLGLCAIGLAVLAAWVALERRTPEPLVHIPTLIKPPVLLTNATTVFMGFGMFCSFLLCPQLVQLSTDTGFGFGRSATTAGFVMVPGTLSMLVSGPLSGVLGGRFGNRMPLSLGGLLCSVGILGLALDHSSLLGLTLWNLLACFGIGFAYAAMPNLIVDAVPQARTGEATGFNAVVRSIGSSLGSQVTAAILVGSAVVAGGAPSETGFETAFYAGAGVALAAAILALFIPRAGHSHLSVAEEIGAASTLPDPALAADR